MLVRLIYASCAVGPLTTDIIQGILDSSRRFNLKNNITGMMCEGNERFIQYLEGERHVVNELYARIMKDVRHEKLVLLEYNQLPERAYADWSMGFVSLQNSNVLKLLEKSTKMTEFYPEMMLPWQALSLIHCLKEQLYPQITLSDERPNDKSARMH
jgi:hypothetical protein